MKDKALKKTLKQPLAQLPYGFSSRVMKQISLEIERRNRRSFTTGIIIAGVTSLIIVAGCIHILNRHFDLNPITGFLQTSFHKLSDPLMLYLAGFFLIALALLILDLTIRQILQRKA